MGLFLFLGAGGDNGKEKFEIEVRDFRRRIYSEESGQKGAPACVLFVAGIHGRLNLNEEEKARIADALGLAKEELFA